jgi:hypothetical protein
MTVRDFTYLIRALEEAGDCCPECVKDHMRQAIDKVYKISKENETR